MYRVLGADHKEYGPVPTDQVRQWIIDRRLNANSLIRPEGETGWKPLSLFPEFESTLATAMPVPVTVGPIYDQGQNGMAITGFICSLLSLVCCCGGPMLAVLGIVFSVIALTQIKRNPAQRGKQIAIAGIVVGAIGIIEFLFLMIGGTFAELIRNLWNF